MKVYDKIISDLQQSIDTPSISKFFRYTLEELQDNPNCLQEIANFLITHEGKYTDFKITTWIDEEKFTPIIMLQLQLSEEWAAHIKPGVKTKLVSYFQSAQKNHKK